MSTRYLTEHLSVMLTDIKGFTDKTSAKSRQELDNLLDIHESIITPIFQEFNGKIIKTIGDAFLVTFKSPTDAVLCGMKIQKVLREYNETASDQEKMEIRIAVNSGEVSLKNNDIFGEAVNIAARIESIAEANEIYFTEAVFLSMNKKEIPTVEIGYRKFKGIPYEIKVYKFLDERDNLSKKKNFFVARDFRAIDIFRKWKLLGIIAAIIFMIAVALGLVWFSGNKKNNYIGDPDNQEADRNNPTINEKNPPPKRPLLLPQVRKKIIQDRIIENKK